jgi:O-antigen ligase
MQTRGGSTALAHVLLLTALVQVPGAQSVAMAAPIALCTLPVLLLSEATIAKNVRLGIATLAGCALLLGCLLAALAHWSQEQLATIPEQMAVAAWFAGAALTVVAVVWSMGRVTPRRGMGLLAWGALFTAALTWSETTEPWKFAAGVPVTLAALVAVSGRGRIVSSIILMASAAVSAVLDARSQVVFAAIGLLALLLPANVRRFGARRPVLSIAGLSACVVALSTGLFYAMSHGYLGTAIAERTNRQAIAGVNPLLGARTEWAASWVLFKDRPLGFGIGVGVDESVQNAAVAAAGAVGGDASGPYFRYVVFGARVDLHSIAVNSWFHFGLLGLMAAGAAVVVIVAAIYRLLVVKAMQLDAAMLFVMAAGLWHLLFSPSGNAPEAAVAVGLALYILSSRRSVGGASVNVLIRRPHQELK